jgi:hypothetical protein
MKRKIELENEINISHIELFEKTFDRTKNDQNNKIREKILENILYLEDSYFKNKEFGSKWTNLKNEFINTLDLDNDTKIVKKAGRSNNYDYYIHYSTGTREKIEFKHGSKSIFKLPQIIQLTDDKLIDSTYAEYFYDNYLEDLCMLCKTTMIPKYQYINNVRKTSSNIEMFNDIKNFEDKTKKNNIVNKSIKNYLQEYKNNIKLTNLEQYIKKSLDKTYLLWDYRSKKFIKEKIHDDFTNPIIKEIKNNNTIVIHSNYEYNLLLRWKNGKGVLNPAWQIAIKMLK